MACLQIKEIIWLSKNIVYLESGIARAKDFFKLIYKPEPTYLGDKISLEDSGDITNDK